MGFFRSRIDASSTRAKGEMAKTLEELTEKALDTLDARMDANDVQAAKAVLERAETLDVSPLKSASDEKLKAMCIETLASLAALSPLTPDESALLSEIMGATE